MLPYLVRNKESGFSLTEMSAVFVMAGILASVTIPSFWGMFQKMEVDEAFNQLQGALQEAQMQAIRRSQDCTITIDTTDKEITGDPGCLLQKRKLPNSVGIDHTGNDTITFNMRGGTGSAKTIVLYNPYQYDPDQDKIRCLAISAGIGLMREGDYQDDPTQQIAGNKCKTRV